MITEQKDLTVTINGVEYKVSVISRIEKILHALYSNGAGSGGSGSSGEPVNINDLTPEQIAELMRIINMDQNP